MYDLIFPQIKLWKKLQSSKCSNGTNFCCMSNIIKASGFLQPKYCSKEVTTMAVIANGSPFLEMYKYRVEADGAGINGGRPNSTTKVQ